MYRIMEIAALHRVPIISCSRSNTAHLPLEHRVLLL